MAEVSDIWTLLAQPETSQSDAVLLERDHLKQLLGNLIFVLYQLGCQSEVILTNSIPEAKQAAGATPVNAKRDPLKNLLIAIETKYLTRKEWCSL